MHNELSSNRPETRLYSRAEKRSLIKRLIAIKDELTWSAIHSDPTIANQIPSRRTLYRIFDGQISATIRDDTARRIENLLVILKNHEANLAPLISLSRNTGSAVRKISGTTRASSQRFLKDYSGCFKSIRLTTNSSQLLVTHLRVFEQAGGHAGFSHVEAIPDEASDLPDRGNRIIEHRGFVLVNGRNVNFVSLFPTLRQLSCLTSSNVSNPTLTGILLTEDAVRHYPFASRVVITKSEDVKDEDIAANVGYGLFELNDKKYGAYRPYVENVPSTNGVLFPTTDI